MKTLKKVSLYLLAIVAFGFASCESENPTKENDGEVITDVTLKFQELVLEVQCSTSTVLQALDIHL
jgi:hypothetical protein